MKAVTMIKVKVLSLIFTPFYVIAIASLLNRFQIAVGMKLSRVPKPTRNGRHLA